MSHDEGVPGLSRVSNDTVWRQTKGLFLAAALLFVVTIVFGFSNALLVGRIPRWQSLIHLHSGTIGWITLSLIGVAIWVFTGDRDVSAGYERTTGLLVWVSVVAFAGYIASFAIAFSQGGVWFTILVAFGLVSMLMIWAAAVYAFTQTRRQQPVTNVHLLVTSGLLVGAVGATLGVVLGMEYVVGTLLQISGERIGIHAAMMETYILIVASALVEWFVRRDGARRWTRAGAVQAIAGALAALIVPVAFLFDLIPVLVPVFAVLLLLFLGLFLGRTGWRAVRTNPLVRGVSAWGFFGTLWLVVFVALFLWLAVGLQGSLSAAPEWYPMAMNHAAFVGMMTNLLFGVYSARTRDTADVLSWGEPWALWLINIGLVLFIGLRIGMGSRHGAFVMGLGALLGVVTMFLRLRAE